MIIRILNDRSIIKDSDPYGTQNENRVTTLNFVIPEEYANFNKKIVFITSDGVYWDLITDDTYIVKNNLTKYRTVSAYVWLTDVESQVDFRTKIFYIDFNQNTNPDNYIPSEEQISGFDTMIAELQELIDEVEQLPGLMYAVVQALPTQDIDEKTIYFVPKTTPETNNAYDKWIYVNNAWEIFGGSSVDLTDYVKNTDYATSSVGGVIKTSVNYATTMGDGILGAINKTYSEYGSMWNNAFISKGTLENVITGKNLEVTTNKVTSLSSSSTDTEYPSAKCVYDLIGDIESALQTLNTGGGVE